MMDKEGNLDELSWEINVPIFKNRLILKQIFIAIGIPFGILVIVLFIIKAYEGLLLIAITFLLTYFFVKFLFILKLFRIFFVNSRFYDIKSRNLL